MDIAHRVLVCSCGRWRLASLPGLCEGCLDRVLVRIGRGLYYCFLGLALSTLFF